MQTRETWLHQNTFSSVARLDNFPSQKNFGGRESWTWKPVEEEGDVDEEIAGQGEFTYSRTGYSKLIKAHFFGPEDSLLCR